MGVVSDLARIAYRAFVTNGVPASGPYSPMKSEIISIFDAIDIATSAGRLVFSTKAQLDAALGYPADTGAEVWADPTPANNGVYRKSGAPGAGAWTKIGDLGIAGLDARIDVLEADAITTDSRLDVLEDGTASFTTDRNKGLARMRRDLADPWRSHRIVMIGDSITYGTGATGVTAPSPNTGQLTDGRDNVDSASYVNQLRKWLGQITCDQQGRAEPAAGAAVYTKNINNDISFDPAVSYVRTSDGAVIDRAGIRGTSANALLGRYLDVPLGYELRFSYTGDGFYVVYASQGGSATASFDIYIDGVLTTNQNTYDAGGGQWSQIKGVGPTFGRHAIRLVPKVAGCRFEAIRLVKTLRLDNQGISGTYSGQWLPAGSLLTGAIPSTATHLFIMLGTNDRITNGNANGRTPMTLSENLRAILDWCATNRPNMRVILQSANMATGTAEQIGNPSVYSFTMADVATAIRRVGDERGIAIIDHYEMTARMSLSGDSFTTDGLHPNDAGHKAIFENIVRAIGGP